MLARGETVGVFQVESQGMRRALVDMRPDRFEDLVVLVALYRPGPMANIPTYCARKLGKEEALRRVKPALSKASESFPVLKVEEELWSGDRMDFRVRALGQVAAGNVQVGEDNVRLELTLPWLLQKFGEAVQETISGRGRVLLEKK